MKFYFIVILFCYFSLHEIFEWLDFDPHHNLNELDCFEYSYYKYWKYLQKIVIN